MKKNLSRLWNKFILVRPYSILDVVLLFFAARSLKISSIFFGEKEILGIFASLALWLYFMFVLEARHKHENRAKISYGMAISYLVMGGAISLYLNPVSLLYLTLYTFSVLLYIEKGKDPFGRISFISRGFIELFLFLYCVSLFGVVNENDIRVAALIFLIYNIRNLLGDIRDIDFDENTFCTHYGKSASYLAVYLMLIAALFLSREYAPPAVFPLFILFLWSLIMDNGYRLHRMSVATTSFVNYLLISGDLGAMLFLFFATITVNLALYDSVPRDSNPRDTVKTKPNFSLFKWL